VNNDLIQPAATLAAALLARNTAPPSFADIANSFELAYNALRDTVQHIENEEQQRGGVVEPL
jgi:hypothetical protein